MNLTFREATIDDLHEIVRMLADDLLGRQRERLEDPLPESYVRAFREIENDPNNELIVAVLSEPAEVPAGSESLHLTHPLAQVVLTKPLSGRCN